MIRMSCPYCESIHDINEIKRIESVEFKGKLVKYEASHFECSECHEIFDSADIMDSNILAIRNAYDAEFESIKPEYIISMREKYNASQKAFGLILGMGELTINSYEQRKSIPNSSNRLLLKLAENPLIFLEMYEKNKDKIGILQREKIESSDVYKSCHKWGGLSSLYERLSSEDRKIIENKTYI